MRIRWDNRLKLLRISTVAIIVSLILLLMFAGFTIYGNKVGNFVINVGPQGDIKLSLSVKQDLSEQTDRLVYGSLTELNDTSYGFLPDNLVENGLGNISDTKDSRYLAYSFYLINNSDRAVDYDMSMTLIDTVGDPLGMIRIMVIEGTSLATDSSNRIYALTESSVENQRSLQKELEKITPYRTQPFLTDGKNLFSITARDFQANAFIRYTIVIWLEGCDPDCDDRHIGDRVKTQLNIKGY